MPDVFISYSRRDEVFVRQLHGALANIKRDVWIDWEDIPLTADWWREIQAGIEAADTFMFIISPDSARSEVCYNEVDYANKNNKRIVPVVYRSPSKEDQQHMHPSVNRHNWVFIHDDDRFERDFEALIAALDTNLAYVREHTRLLMRAKEWAQRDRDNSLLLRGRDLQDAENLLVESAHHQTPKPTDLQTEYIFASRRIANRRQSATLGSVVFGLIVAIGLAFFAFISFRQAEANLLLSQETQSLFLADLSRQEREGEHYRIALLLALEALDNFPRVTNGQSNRALLDALTGPPHKLIALRHNVGPISGVRWNQDESRILSVAGNAVTIWDASIGDVSLTLQHDDTARGGAWNRDESRLLTWSADGTARVWDPFIETELYRLPHDGPVNGAVWIEDGSRILTWSDDGTVRIWDALSGNSLARFEHVGPVQGVVWHQPTRRMLAWADNMVSVWSLAPDSLNSAQQLFLAHDDRVNGAVWNADGSRILSWSRDTTARIWDAATGQIAQLLSHDNVVNGALWNAAEDRVLSWDRSSTARVWNVADATSCPLAHDGNVNGALWDKAGLRVLSWSNDRTVRVWDDPCAAPGRVVLTYDRSVEGAKWNVDESQILSWSADNTVRIWDIASQQPIFVFRHGGPVSRADWSSDESQVLSSSLDNVVQVWAVARNEDTQPPILDIPHPQKVNGAVWNASQSRILTWASDGLVRVWDASAAASAVPLVTMQHEGAVNGAVWNPDESRILSWSADRTARIWDSAGSPVGEIIRHERPVIGALWYAEGQRILTWSDDGTARLWDAQGGPFSEPLQHEGSILGAVWNGDESRLLTWSSDGTARLWDDQGLPLGSVMQHGSSVLGAAWNAEESRILTWSSDSTARLWGADGEPLETLVHDATVLGGAWSANGQKVLTWTRGNNVIVWDTASAVQLAALPHGTSSFGVQGAVWNQDGSRILSWSSNGVVRVWDIPADGRAFAAGGSELLRNTLRHDRFVVGARWNEDETRVLSWSTDDTARIWDITQPRQNDVLFLLEHGDAVNNALWNPDESRVLTWNIAGVVRQWVVDVETLIEVGRQRTVEPLTNAERALFFLPALEATSTGPTATPARVTN